MLDIEVLNEKNEIERPWLTIVLDDYSRAIAGFRIEFGTPDTERASLVLRQAIWKKGNSNWPICGIPEKFYLEVLNLDINTQNEYGQYFIRVFKMLLESEKVLVQERTSHGLNAAREKGRKGGRPQKIEKSQKQNIKQLYDNDKYTGEEIAQMTGLSRTSIYRIIRETL